MKFENPSTENIRALLNAATTIAVVGFSPLGHRLSYRVASGLQRAGYKITAVRPGIHWALGEPAYPKLSALPFKPDIVDVFRSGEHVPALVDECLELGLKILWLQDGIVNFPAAEKAIAGGMTVVMDRCILRDRQKLIA